MALSLDPDRSNDIHLELDDEYDQGLDNFGELAEFGEFDVPFAKNRPDQKLEKEEFRQVYRWN